MISISFHTIKSILNTINYEITSCTATSFHTIKSILNTSALG